MTSRDFPAATAPLMTGAPRHPHSTALARGGPAHHPRHDVTVIVPLGALSGGAAPVAAPAAQATPGGVHPLAQEMHVIVAQVRSLLARMRMTPGVDQARFGAGAADVERGMLMIAASMPRPR